MVDDDEEHSRRDQKGQVNILGGKSGSDVR